MTAYAIFFVEMFDLGKEHVSLGESMRNQDRNISDLLYILGDLPSDLSKRLLYIHVLSKPEMGKLPVQ